MKTNESEINLNDYPICVNSYFLDRVLCTFDYVHDEGPVNVTPSLDALEGLYKGLTDTLNDLEKRGKMESQEYIAVNFTKSAYICILVLFQPSMVDTYVIEEQNGVVLNLLFLIDIVRREISPELIDLFNNKSEELQERMQSFVEEPSIQMDKIGTMCILHYIDRMKTNCDGTKEFLQKFIDIKKRNTKLLMEIIDEMLSLFKGRDFDKVLDGKHEYEVLRSQITVLQDTFLPDEKWQMEVSNVLLSILNNTYLLARSYAVTMRRLQHDTPHVYKKFNELYFSMFRLTSLAKTICEEEPKNVKVKKCACGDILDDVTDGIHKAFDSLVMVLKSDISPNIDIDCLLSGFAGATRISIEALRSTISNLT